MWAGDCLEHLEHKGRVTSDRTHRAFGRVIRVECKHCEDAYLVSCSLPADGLPSWVIETFEELRKAEVLLES